MTTWFRCTGQIGLPEARLYHYKARVYDPGLGRFLQTDPIGYDDQMNLYAYVGNDPLGATDPTGMESDDIFRRWFSFARARPEYDHEAETSRISPTPQGQSYTEQYAGAVLSEFGEGYANAAVNAVDMAANGMVSAVADGDAAGVAVARATLAVAGPGKGRALQAASAPVGRRGAPIQVLRGTNSPGRVGGRDYTGHAFDQMQSRGITPSAVDSAI